MFYPYYKSLKDRLTDQVKALKDIQKYNDQYSGSNLSECVALIEFPDQLPMPYISKTTQRISISMVVHIVSKIMSDIDGVIPDEQYKEHDDLIDDVVTALKEYQLTYASANLSRPLQITGYQEVGKYRGWFVTKIFLSTKD
jgi:hypothetical protein